MQTIEEFTEKYLAESVALFQTYREKNFSAAMEILTAAYHNDATIFVCGNGGSAGTGSHIVNDLSKGTIVENKRRLRVLGLCDNMSLFSAYANDCGYESVFAEQLKSLWRPQDVLIAISASGNSANVLRAAEYARENSGSTIGLVGFSGGKLKELCSVAIHFHSFNYGAVEDAQLMFSHLSSQYLHHYIGEKGATLPSPARLASRPNQQSFTDISST